MMDSFFRNEYVLTLIGMGLFQMWAYRAKVSLWSLLAIALIETGITVQRKQHAKLLMLIGMDCVLIMIIFLVRRTM